ncbi:MAG: pseudouridine-5'-phosphate glycosidase [Anaerolineae bacterium]|nr:pseudouridine-5'-phosphate glycosidase [Anaerolineae bacterium]
MNVPPWMEIRGPVREALAAGSPVVALESTVIAHGLPHPHNIELALDMERILTSYGVTPATIGVLGGRACIGLTPAEIEYLATASGIRKLSRRDMAIAIAQGLDGATTVAGTLLLAHLAGMRVFCTGGIGGVHRSPAFDVSGDLPALAETPMIAVCAGAKAILDLPATREWLETHAVPVLGYNTDEFPAFFTPRSGLMVDAAVRSPAEVARIALRHWETGMRSAVLVAVPPPAEEALAPEVAEAAISQALTEAEERGVRGWELTPFVLDRLVEITAGASLRANLALLRNNAHVAAQIAKQISRGGI